MKASAQMPQPDILEDSCLRYGLSLAYMRDSIAGSGLQLGYGFFGGAGFGAGLSP